MGYGARWTSLTLACVSIASLPAEIHRSASVLTQELFKKLSSLQQASWLICNQFWRTMGNNGVLFYLDFLCIFSIISLSLPVFKMWGLFLPIYDPMYNFSHYLPWCSPLWNEKRNQTYYYKHDINDKHCCNKKKKNLFSATQCYTWIKGPYYK